MHFFRNHHNKKDRITEDNTLLQRRVTELDTENQSLRGSEQVIIREDIAKNAHLMQAPVSGGTQVGDFEEETLTIKRRSAASANDLALGKSDAQSLRAGQSTRLAAAGAQGGAGSTGASYTIRRMKSKDPPRIIHAEIIRPGEKHIMKESGCITAKASDAKDGDLITEELDMKSLKIDKKSGDLIEEEVDIKLLEREVPQKKKQQIKTETHEAPQKKKQQIKTETHVNYIPMGRPKAHERFSPTPGSDVVDHLQNKLDFQTDAKSSGTPLHKNLGFPLSESMTKLPKGLDADKARLKTFERDVELSQQERLVKRNAIVDGVLNAGEETSFEEELEYQKIVHQL